MRLKDLADRLGWRDAEIHTEDKFKEAIGASRKEHRQKNASKKDVAKATKPRKGSKAAKGKAAKEG